MKWLQPSLRFFCRTPRLPRVAFVAAVLLAATLLYYQFRHCDLEIEEIPPKPHQPASTWDWYNQHNGGLIKSVFEIDPYRVNHKYRRLKSGNIPSIGVSSERICIMQSDTRPFPRLKPGEIFAGSNHYSIVNAYYLAYYAVSFGYTYRRLEMTPIQGRHQTWSKLPAMWDTLTDPRCDIVVVFDGDAFPNALTVPLEAMMDRWGFGLNSTFLMAHDPDGEMNYFGGNLATNFGLWFLRRNQNAFQLLTKIMSCPDKVPGCDRWKWEFAHEQAAFAQYFKNTYDQGRNREFVIAPCDEANGHWEFLDCKGSIVTHGWSVKGKIPGRLESLVLKDTLIYSIHKDFELIIKQAATFIKNM